MHIDVGWAAQQTPARLLAVIIATGEAQGSVWNYKTMAFEERKKK